MAKKKPAVEEEQEAGVPEWVVTFGDMMSLLLTFFIMLFSMSEVREEERYQAVLEALRQQFGYDSTRNFSVPGKVTKPRNSELSKRSSLGRARRANTMNGGDRVKAPVGEHPRVMIIRHGNRPTLGGVVYFESLSADLTEASIEQLKDIARTIGGKMQRIDIRGHTTNQRQPNSSPFKDNWDLAYARARNVSNYLEKIGIDPKRIRVSVSAGNEPIDTDVSSNFRKNARVEISVLNELTQPVRKDSSEISTNFSTPATP